MKSVIFVPPGKRLEYVSSENIFLQEAENFAKKYSTDPIVQTGAVIVKNGNIIGRGANFSIWHKWLFCVRKLFRVQSGKWYGLCPGCSPINHAEAQAIQDARKNFSKEITGASLYLWGHYWCCESCWEKMEKAGIKTVFLREDAAVFFREKFKKNLQNSI